MNELSKLIDTNFIENLVDVDNYSKRLIQFNNTTQPKLISVWKAAEEFHLGQYFCLMTLIKLLECNSKVEILIGQNKEEFMNSEVAGEYTKSFIKIMASENKPNDIHITSLRNTNINNKKNLIRFEQFNKFLIANKGMPIIDVFSDRHWIENDIFINSLLNLLVERSKENDVNGDYLFLISGSKHLDIWESIFQFFNEELEIRNFFPIYLKDILGMNDKSMSSEFRDDDIFTSFNLSSRVKRKEIAENILKLSTDREKRHIHDRIIYQIVNPIEIENKQFLNLDHDDKVEFLTEFISIRINRWIEFKKELLKKFNRVEINNTYLLEFLQKQYYLEDIDNLLPESKEEIDINPEKFREEYWKLVIQAFDCVIEDFKNDMYVEELKSLIRHSSNIDIISYLFEKWHRDHYLHQFNVAALGEFFLSVYTKEDETLLDVIKKNGWEENEVKLSWWTAALLHDHAYPIEKLLKLLNDLKLLEKTYKITQFTNDVINTMRQTKTISDYFNSFFLNNVGEKSKNEVNFLKLKTDGINVFNELGIKSDFNPHSHAHLGVINILSKINSNNSVDNIKKDNYPSWLIKSLIAISKHHKRESTISLYEEPISFLLILCDELQEWTRRQFTSKNGVEFTHSINQTTIELFRDIDKLTFPDELDICYRCSDIKILKEIEWDFNIFLKDKFITKNTLDFQKQRPTNNPKSIRYGVNIYSP